MHRALGLVCILLSGCALDAQDIDGWSGVAGGPERLAGYLADGHRPAELRLRAARALVARDDFGLLQSVLDQAEDGPALVKALAPFARESLASEDAPARWRGVALGYLLLERATDLEEAAAQELAVALAEFALRELYIAEVPGKVAPEMALLGAAVARSNDVVPLMAAAAQREPNEARFLYLVALLAELRDPVVEEHMATVLLERARRSFPALSGDLVASMKANGNETVLRFLAELIRDGKLPDALRIEGFNAASRLGPRAIPTLLRVLATPDLPFLDLFLALRSVWQYGGPAQLATALRALSPEGPWPTEGAGFKDEVEAFCDNRLAEKPNEVKPILTELVGDPNWVTRAFALACISRLYPDEAAGLLEPLRKDKTPLPGWSEAGEPMTFASAVAALGR